MTSFISPVSFMQLHSATNLNCSRLCNVPLSFSAKKKPGKGILLFERTAEGKSSVGRSDVVIFQYSGNVVVSYKGRVDVPNEGARAKISVTAPAGVQLSVGGMTHTSNGGPKEYLLNPFKPNTGNASVLPVVIGNTQPSTEVWVSSFKGPSSRKAVLAFRGPMEVPVHRQEFKGI